MSYYLSKVPHENLIALNNVEHTEDGPTACFGDRPDGFGGAFLVTKIGEHDNVFPSEVRQVMGRREAVCVDKLLSRDVPALFQGTNSNSSCWST